ncbi:hypothetical protein AVEN_202791-1, partial [Araneus ventricosus]
MVLGPVVSNDWDESKLSNNICR